jgi:hypothetical protein
VKGITGNDLAAYLRKYVAKGVDVKAGGRCWGCSESLEKIDFCELDEVLLDDFLRARPARIYEEFCIVPGVRASDLPAEAQMKFVSWHSDAITTARP